MAGVIVLDASVLIAYLDAGDAHHVAAEELLERELDEELVVGTLTIAEVLVAPARAGRLDDASDAVGALGAAERPIRAGAAGRLAQLRAETGLRMPDCCVLLAADDGARIATFDRRLATAAGQLGFEVVS